ncbi:uncharacterized protein LOC112086102 [Eutrema salsugineum]|uniref:uncharacterized protein LOC112086102 n=1 Tax=Eutrema salsugineum TaxID=72664 RepID=UPI000CED0C34|nr:uncharacterized protein LOC112086102 [Eutrema salsugineum]
MDIGDGSTSSFWHDRWAPTGKLHLLTGDRGFIDLGISEESTVQDVILTHRRRRHRITILNRIEDEIEGVKQPYRVNTDNNYIWRSSEDTYQESFSTKATRNQLRIVSPKASWAKGIWFRHHCPKYRFIAWLALHIRLTTRDHMQVWSPNIPMTCIQNYSTNWNAVVRQIL